MKLHFFYISIAATFLTGITATASAKDYAAEFFDIKADSTTLNTRAIQFGIDYISQNGGGRLVFQPENTLPVAFTLSQM